METRLIPYLRVSTAEQDDHGHSLPTQQRGGVEYIDRQNVKPLEGDFSEDYTGMSPLRSRPVGAKVIKALEAGEAQGVVVYRIDRLSRDWLDLMLTVREFLSKGWQIHSVDLGQIKSEMDLNVIFQSLMAQREWNEIKEKTTRGRFGKAREGKVIGMGVSPYGYRYKFEAGRSSTHPKAVGLEIYEPEASVIRHIFEWYVFGEGQHKPLSAYGIASRLNDMGVPAPGTRKENAKTRGLWTIETVNFFMKSTTYRGVWRFGKTVGKNGKQGERPTEEQVEVAVPEIVGEELWYKAQDQREANKRHAKRNARYDYLLRGMGYCKCGASLQGNTDSRYGHVWHYYRCATRSHHNKQDAVNRTCQAGYVRADKLEPAVWEYVVATVLNHERFDEAMQHALKTAAQTVNPKRDELQRVSQAKRQTEAEMNNLIRQMAKMSEKQADAAQGILDEYSEKLAGQTEREKQLQLELYGTTLTDDMAAMATEFQRRLARGIEMADQALKRKVLEMLHAEVKQDGDDKRFAFTCRLQVSSVIDLNTSRNTKTNHGILWLFWLGPELPVPLPPHCIIPAPHLWVECKVYDGPADTWHRRRRVKEVNSLSD